MKQFYIVFDLYNLIIWFCQWNIWSIFIYLIHNLNQSMSNFEKVIFMNSLLNFSNKFIIEFLYDEIAAYSSFFTLHDMGEN